MDQVPVDQQLADARALLEQLRVQIGRVVVGQQGVVEGLLTAVAARGHLLLEGVPGLGKTLLVRTLAQCLDLSFARIQFTPDLMPADVLGTTVLVESEGGGRAFEFRRGPVFAHVVLADEINRATPKTQSALLEAMQEHTVTVGTTTHELPQPFFVLATQNPLEMEGTYPLPEAQLDRFLLKVRVPFPPLEELVRILERTTGTADDRPQAVASARQLVALQELVRALPAASHVVSYAARIVLATHPDQPGAPEEVRKFVRFGASPRGAQALLLAGKVRALAAGRANLSYEDVRAAALAALRHRLIPNFDAQAEGVDADRLVERALAVTPEDAPR